MSAPDLFAPAPALAPSGFDLAREMFERAARAKGMARQAQHRAAMECLYAALAPKLDGTKPRTRPRP